MKKYYVSDNSFFVLDKEKRAYLMYVNDNWKTTDLFSISVSNENLTSLLSLLETSDDIKWENTDGSLTVSGSEDNVEFTFSVSRELTVSQSQNFMYALKDITKNIRKLH